jgi:O-methyltransferase
MKSAIGKIARAAGYEIRKAREFRADFDSFERDVIRKVQPFTMTSPERIVGLMDAIRYVTRAGIQGAIVECGVWRGGSIMAAALTLQHLGHLRDIYLFDTFDGMNEPSSVDRKRGGRMAKEKFQSLRTSTGSNWCRASLDDVRGAIQTTGYPSKSLHFVKGKVEDTIPQNAPAAIALLRLDTDWYESTKHELIHLYPKLMHKGVLIIDDYGSWEGARLAVDEYFGSVPVLFNRTDFSGRMAIKA